MGDSELTLALTGDVMLGRGIDQILPHPGDPTLRESYVHDARRYVELAEAVNGPIPRPVDFAWPWGDALAVLAAAAPDVRVINLETSVTRSDDFAPGKAVHYRMTPENLPSLAVAEPDVCVLANNHVLDFGPHGLTDTLAALSALGLRTAGAGLDVREARRPATVDVDTGRVLVLSVGHPSSGVSAGWAATDSRPGVDVVADLSDAAAAAITSRVEEATQPDDVVVASIHWGSNWGYDVSRDQTRFAHRLVDGGVDIVHGHSSHHPRPIEVYRDRLILYGCGDLVDDYEGISGYEKYRDDLRLLYFVSVQRRVGRLLRLRMAPLRAVGLRLRHASRDDTAWLATTIGRASRRFGSRVEVATDGMLDLVFG